MSDLQEPLYIRVEGRPAPQGSKSPKGRTKSGRAIMVEASKYVKPWRKEVAKAAVAAMVSSGWTKSDHPIWLEVDFYLHRPGDRPKRTRVYPTRYPDLSKLVRSTEDALTSAGVWGDDAQIVDEHTHKRYAYPYELTAIRLKSDWAVTGALVIVKELPYVAMDQPPFRGMAYQE